MKINMNSICVAIINNCLTIYKIGHECKRCGKKIYEKICKVIATQTNAPVRYRAAAPNYSSFIVL